MKKLVFIASLGLPFLLAFGSPDTADAGRAPVFDGAHRRRRSAGTG
jgi:hypothetical protein